MNENEKAADLLETAACLHVNLIRSNTFFFSKVDITKPTVNGNLILEKSDGFNH